MKFSWQGVFPALLTPFTENDELDLDMFEKNLHAQIDAGRGQILCAETWPRTALEDLAADNWLFIGLPFSRP